MDNYQIIVRDKNNNLLGEFTEWESLSFSEKLNGYGECVIKIPVTSRELAQLVSMRRYETLVYKNGSIIWSGEQSNRNAPIEKNSPNWVSVISYSFLEGLIHMYTPSYVRYDQIDEGAILKDLVDVFQAQTGADLGYTFGSYLTGTLRDREYNTYNIYDAFENMSNVINGPDFYITHDKQINIVKHKGVDRSKQVVLEWGTNIESITIDENFSNPATQTILLGAGFGSEQMRSVVTDTSARSVYGLRQQRSSEIDVSIQSTLDAKAQALLNKYKSPLVTVDLKQTPTTNPKFGTILLGDTIRLKVNKGIYNINNNFRVYGYNIDVDKNQTESISYILGSI